MTAMPENPGAEQLRRDIRDDYRFCLYRLEVMRQRESVEPKGIDGVTERMRILREKFPSYLADLIHRA